MRGTTLYTLKFLNLVPTVRPKRFCLPWSRLACKTRVIGTKGQKGVLLPRYSEAWDLRVLDGDGSRRLPKRGFPFRKDIFAVNSDIAAVLRDAGHRGRD